MPPQAGGIGSGLPASAPPSAETLRRVRVLGQHLGLDPDMVDRALINLLAAYEPIPRSREPGDDDE